MSPKHLNRNVRQFAYNYMIREANTNEQHFVYSALVTVHGLASGAGF